MLNVGKTGQKRKRREFLSPGVGDQHPDSLFIELSLP